MKKSGFDLKKIRKGTRLKIVGYDSQEIPLSYRRRLLSLGLLPNTEFTLTRIAPLGDPIEIQVRNFSLILRKHELGLLTLALA